MSNIKYEVVDSSPFSFQNTPPPPQFHNPSAAPTFTGSNPQPTESFGKNGIGMNFETQSFDQRVADYVKKNNPVLYILTPCYGSMCFVNYVSCIMNTLDVLRSLNIKVQVEFCKNDSLVSRARNNLVARAMNDRRMTHILFIDSDITWDPSSILKLLVADKHVVGGVYPLKHYMWEKLISDPANPYKSNIIQSWIKTKNESQLRDIVTDEVFIQNRLLSYNINYLDNYLTIDNNLAKVKHTATGFMMIQRSVIETMMRAFPSTKYVDDVHFLKPEENQFAYALFDCGVEDGHYYSEDWLFCHRWTKMGGNIFIDVSVNLNHTGIEDYVGSYITSILN